MEPDDYRQFIKSNIGGAAQPQANAVVLTSMRLVAPPKSIAEKFDRLVTPMIDEAELLAVKTQTLRRTRDLLLPRLLSGQAAHPHPAVPPPAPIRPAATFSPARRRKSWRSSA